MIWLNIPDFGNDTSLCQECGLSFPDHVHNSTLHYMLSATHNYINVILYTTIVLASCRISYKQWLLLKRDIANWRYVEDVYYTNQSDFVFIQAVTPILIQQSIRNNYIVSFESVAPLNFTIALPTWGDDTGGGLLGFTNCSMMTPAWFEQTLHVVAARHALVSKTYIQFQLAWHLWFCLRYILH